MTKFSYSVFLFYFLADRLIDEKFPMNEKRGLFVLIIFSIRNIVLQKHSNTNRKKEKQRNIDESFIALDKFV
jgi:hypothetical protein